MAEDRSKRRLKINIGTSSEIMSDTDRQVSESIIARMVARAYAIEHTEQFGPKLQSSLDIGRADDRSEAAKGEASK